MSNRPANFNQMRRPWRCAILAIPITSSCHLVAQGATAHQGPSPDQAALAQIQALTNRLALLEQKLAKIDKRLYNDEGNSTNDPGTPNPVGGDTPPSAPSGGLSLSDQGRLAKLEQEVGPLESPQKGDKGFVGHPNRVTAPFQVVDNSGAVIMSVDAGKAGVAGGIKVQAPNGTYVQIGPGSHGWNGVRVYDAARGVPRAFMGFAGASNPEFSLAKADGATSVQLGIENNNSEIDFYNSGGKVAAMMGANLTSGEGHAEYSDASGKTLTFLGAAGEHGDVQLLGPGNSFDTWDQFILGLAMIPH